MHDKNNSRNKGFYDTVDDNTPGNSEFRIPNDITLKFFRADFDHSLGLSHSPKKKNQRIHVSVVFLRICPAFLSAVVGVLFFFFSVDHTRISLDCFLNVRQCLSSNRCR